ncbi:hypothetical protein lacNasYZ03_02580 [Lactobacillus nasalidis]|uniref:FAD-binding FR-type domain-containing protein n=1 Tax=Lactobacillus nasalidis TaxID=2797258 RepID=A0ABQ3W2N6_9LACO|nr:iron reductase [Lactobacillus nasalidis]GHV97399.1 hypothetical protein lacNasYZ01_05810 [Lactobacillus nasalidis]GHV99798.1 hypothetical protein lacNasYZ02_12280 [Lactobacillus nasalidis]GHW00571.1 hypothetical protein lacNasYZ03_02580 [Lactobacillus nasalidis]
MFKKHDYTLGVLWAAAFFILPLPFIQTLEAGLPAAYQSEKLAIMAGTIAYVWLLLAIYLSTRPHWLDRLIGLPKVYMIHGIMSIGAIFLAWLHMEGAPSAGLIKQTGNAAFYLFLALALYSLVFMAGWLTKRVPFLAKIKRLLEEKVFRHEVSIWLHRLNLLAVLLVFVHIQLIPYIRAITPFMAWIWAATVFVFASYFLSLAKSRGKNNAELLSRRLVADNVLELTLKTDQDLADFEPGDYIFLSFPDEAGLEEPHPFSFVNLPRDEKQITLAIRGDGDFTRQLQELAPPVRARISPSFGRYQEAVAEQKPDQLLIIAGGIGVVPLLSVIDGNPDLPAQVFYNAHTRDSLIYEEKFLHWSSRGNFKSRCQVGRFKDEEVLGALPQNLSGLQVLIGGPQAMADHWIGLLKGEGLPAGQIYYEEFDW